MSPHGPDAGPKFRGCRLTGFAFLLAALLGWWGWCFLGEIYFIAQSGTYGSRSANPVVQDFIVLGLDRPAMALHIGLLAGLGTVVFRLRHGDLAAATARMLLALHGAALSTIALLWLPLVRWMFSVQWMFPLGSTGPGYILLASFAWWSVACNLALLYCRSRSYIIPWLFLATAAGCLAGVFKLLVWSTVDFGTKLPGCVSPWVFAAAVSVIAVCAVIASLLKAERRETMLWLAAVVATTIVQAWILCCLSPFVLLGIQVRASSYYWLNLPLHAGFVAAEVIMAYIIWSNRRRLFHGEEHRGGFPVIQNGKDASS